MKLFKKITRMVHPASSVFFSLLLVALVYLITLSVLEKRGFWVVDNSNKFLQLKAIIDNNYSDYSIPWPGERIDPDFIYNPLPSPFSQVKDNKLYSIFSPFFAFISSFFFRLLGFPGLYMLPVVSSIVMLAGLAKITEKIDMKPQAKHLAVLIAGLCTPVWFYSVTFWEHTAAVCFCIWAVYFYLKFIQDRSIRNLIIGSVLAVLGIYFRDELYLLCAVLIAALLLYTPGDRVKTGMIALISMFLSIIPLWIFQWNTIGQPFGFHLGSHLFSVSGIAEHIAARPIVLYNMFVASTSNIWFSLVISAPFIAVFLLNPRFSPRTFLKIVPLYCLAALISSCINLQGYFTSDSPIVWMLQANSLFTTSPIIALAFLRWKDSGKSPVDRSFMRWIWIVALAYAVVYGLGAPEMGSTGIHWGNRYLLVLYPLFSVLAAVNLVQWYGKVKRNIGLRSIVIVITLAIGLIAQVYSIHLLRIKKDFTLRLNREIQNRPEEIVFSNAFWVSQELYTVFYDKSIFYVANQNQFEQLSRTLATSGYDRFLFFTQGLDDRSSAADVLIDDGSLNIFDVKVFSGEF